MSADTWATASARAFCAIVRDPDLALAADLDTMTLTTPWRGLAERFRDWLDEEGSGHEDAAERLAAFLRSIPDEDLPLLGVATRPRIVQRLQAAVKAAPMRDGIAELAAARQAHDDDHDAYLPAEAPVQEQTGDGFIRLSDVAEREVDWYWPGRIASANVVLVAGDGGVGKSTLVQELAARMTRGQAVPGGAAGPARGVVILSAEEDTAAVVRPRMRLMGADLERVTILDIDATGLTLPSGAERLEARCRAESAGLLVIDTGPAFLDPGLKSNNEEDVRRFFAPLRAIAERLRLVVIVLAHLNKDTTRAAGQRIMGGAAWRNVPRQVLMVGPPPGEDPRETGERLVAVEKNNYGTFGIPAVAFRITSAPDDPSRAVVGWGGEVAGIRASDLVGSLPSAEERTEREAAREFLLAELSDGPRPVSELEAAARTAGLAWATVRRAKSDAGVTSERVGGTAGSGSWMWALGTPAAKVLTPPKVLTGARREHLSETPHGNGDSGGASLLRCSRQGDEHLRAPTDDSGPRVVADDDLSRWTRMAADEGWCATCERPLRAPGPGKPVCHCEDSGGAS